ncbi:MAG TPA: ABC transporter ATP-binding protein [Candidatus Eremiobacteraceae bacterium]|nr:ABC transporter ATP-binding protein [Candidatus Eremiobacteraceae bacterium]
MQTVCMASQHPAAVRANGLTKRYGSLEAVRGISFEIAPSECYGFLGRNGAGKTTTMKMIYCRIARTAGSLHVLGLDAASSAHAIKSRIGVVTQDNALDQELTVMENLLVYGSFFGLRPAAAERRARELLAMMSLGGKERAKYKELSGGMRRRLVIARALVNEPELLVLDEPTTGLDPQARLMVWETLNGLRERGLTLIITTHYMEEAARLCDRIAVMEEGRIFAEDTPAGLVKRFAAAEVLEVTADAAQADALARTDAFDGLVHRRERHGDITYLYTDDNSAVLARLSQAGLGSSRHVARAATLEDVFLNITGRELGE